jgi:thiol-disulfide isomerase/thioredoxin
MRALNMAERAGETNALARLKKAEKAQMDDPNASPESRFGVRFSEIQREATAKGEPGSAGFNDSFEKGLQQLEKEFPKRTEVQDLKLQLASLSEPAKAKQLAEEVLKSDAGPQAKETAKTLIAKMERVGKPVDISFKAVDGRDVDLAKLKGKVVLVDFWATWCGPCVAELPHVKAAYADLHPKGFEVVGISLDSDKSRLTKFVADQKMAWPQYFDGKQWQNEISTKFGIQSIPAMWLIDKKGNLRDINARGDLKGKIEKLLAEQ